MVDSCGIAREGVAAGTEEDEERGETAAAGDNVAVDGDNVDARCG